MPVATYALLLLAVILAAGGTIWLATSFGLGLGWLALAALLAAAVLRLRLRR